MSGVVRRPGPVERAVGWLYRRQVLFFFTVFYVLAVVPAVWTMFTS